MAKHTSPPLERFRETATRPPVVCSGMTTAIPIPVAIPLAEPIPTVQPVPKPAPLSVWGNARRVVRVVGSGFEWLFGLGCLLVALAILASIPVLQFLSLGYLLEVGGRIARTGRFAAGFIGLRFAARLGGIAGMSWLFLLPCRFVASLAESAEIIEPGSSIARGWRIGLIALLVLTSGHILFAIANGGRIRNFLHPFNAIFVLVKATKGGFYRTCRDAVWEAIVRLRLPYYAWLGVRGFAIAMLWLILPISMLAAGRLGTPLGGLIAVLGGFQLIPVLIYLPFMQLKFAQTGRFRDGFNLLAVRRDYRKAPWMCALAFVISLLFAVPLYLLKIEVVPQDAAWLPGLVFIAFIYPSRILAGWALGRATRREEPRHWFFRWTGRLPFLPVAAAYVIIAFFAQYTSWNGVWSLYEQHAFLVPVPFFGL